MAADKRLEKRIVGIVPAAGKGSRLAPLPSPKELFPIGYQDFTVDGNNQKRPKVISQYLIENIIAAGASQIIFVLGEDKHDIMRYYGDGSRFRTEIAYLYQEKLHGMPYAINLARNWIGDADVLFGMPDTIIEPKNVFQQLLAHHKKTSSDVTLGLFSTNNPSKFGMVEFDTEGIVKQIIDKPLSSHLRYMWGCACWSESFTELIDAYLGSYPYNNKEIVLGDIFSFALNEKLKVSSMAFKNGQYIDIGTVDELDAALKKFHL